MSIRRYAFLCFLGLVVSFLLTSFFTVVSAVENFKLPKTLPKHPRLFFTEKRQKELEQLAKRNPFLQKQIEALLAKADKVLKEQPSQYLIPDGKRLLAQSRRSIDRTTALAFAYRMTGKKEYAEAAVEEMRTVCRFKDWNPSHYLDTAEMATAVALGYDWLYDTLSEEIRKELRTAIVQYAFDTALPIYKANRWWTKSHNNWNEVCNAGLTVAALAIAEDEPQKSEAILAYAIASMPNGLAVYKPDGAYPEGPTYWSYGGTFTGLMIMALKDVLGSDYGLLQTPGLEVTGDYHMSMISPINLNFNYADCGERGSGTPWMYALATCYDRPDYAVWQRDFLQKTSLTAGDRFAVFQALWYTPKGSASSLANTPKARLFRGIQDVVVMRTSWNSPDAVFVGFKGGDNKANHGHMDIGSFVLDAGGIRWAYDLGSDNYNMPGYFGKNRWNYYRMNNKSHNTLVIGDKIQDPKAVCRITDFSDKIGIARAVCDMSAAYTGQAKSVVRTLTLEKNGTVTIEDMLEGVAEPVRWGMATRASIKTAGKKAILNRNKKEMNVELFSDQAGEWSTLAMTPPTEIENQNKGYSMLAALAQPKDGKVAFKVVFRMAEPKKTAK